MLRQAAAAAEYCGGRAGPGPPTHSGHRSLTIRILVRAAVLGAVVAAYIAVIPVIWRDDPGGGADIGAGLVAFGFLVVAGLVWALLDGRRYDLGGVIACWFVVGALLGVLMWLSIVVREDVPLFHDVFFIPFLAFQVGVPAALGAAIGRALRR